LDEADRDQPQSANLENIDSPVTISPDGQRVAFVRWNPDQRESGLWVANIDGTSEQKLATRKDPETFGRWGAFGVNGGPAWSPDGKVIACGVSGFENGAFYGTMAEVGVADGAQRVITSHKWARGGRVAWLGDGSGLVMNAVEPASGPYSQLWYLSYPEGKARRITNDLNDYSDVTVTNDSVALLAIQTDMQSQVWVAPDGDAGRARQITSGRSEGTGGLTWTADGKVVYISRGSSNDVALWMADGDGAEPRQITSDASAKSDPAVSPDGRHIVFSSNRTGSFHLWRINADGSNLQQLTDGDGELTPAFSADGRWVVYSVRGNKKTLWKVSIDGGAPAQLSGLLQASLPAVSPDGKLIACWTHTTGASAPVEGGSAPRFKLGVLPFEGGQPLKVIEISPTADHTQRFQWTADGSAIVYCDKRGGVSNLWSQPLGGGAPKQLTDFDSEQIFAFAWSRDNRQLAVARGVNIADVIMITDFR
jgi:Tol biopolymer transport system component